MARSHSSSRGRLPAVSSWGGSSTDGSGLPPTGWSWARSRRSSGGSPVWCSCCADSIAWIVQPSLSRIQLHHWLLVAAAAAAAAAAGRPGVGGILLGGGAIGVSVLLYAVGFSLVFRRG